MQFKLLNSEDILIKNIAKKQLEVGQRKLI